MRYLVSWLVWLLIGALTYHWYYGDPIPLDNIVTWGVIVFWPLVLAWSAMWWIGIGFLALACGAVIAFLGIFAIDAISARRRKRANAAR